MRLPWDLRRSFAEAYAKAYGQDLLDADADRLGGLLLDTVGLIANMLGEADVHRSGGPGIDEVDQQTGCCTR